MKKKIVAFFVILTFVVIFFLASYLFVEKSGLRQELANYLTDGEPYEENNELTKEEDKNDLSTENVNENNGENNGENVSRIINGKDTRDRTERIENKKEEIIGYEVWLLDESDKRELTEGSKENKSHTTSSIIIFTEGSRKKYKFKNLLKKYGDMEPKMPYQMKEYNGNVYVAFATGHLVLLKVSKTERTRKLKVIDCIKVAKGQFLFEPYKNSIYIVDLMGNLKEFVTKREETKNPWYKNIFWHNDSNNLNGTNENERVLIKRAEFKSRPLNFYFYNEKLYILLRTKVAILDPENKSLTEFKVRNKSSLNSTKPILYYDKIIFTSSCSDLKEKQITDSAIQKIGFVSSLLFSSCNRDDQVKIKEFYRRDEGMKTDFCSMVKVGKYLWVIDRAANELLIFSKNELLRTFKFSTQRSLAPHKIEFIDDLAYVIFRGPYPEFNNLPGINNARGLSPGIAVLRILDNGSNVSILKKINVSFKVDNEERSDPIDLMIRKICVDERE
jgi:hypothetical protein